MRVMTTFQTPRAGERMIAVEDAQQRVLAEVAGVGTERMVIADGTPIGAAEIGVLAGVQKSVVRVARRPVVAILSTGDEIVDVDEPRPIGKVVNSNSYSLAALARDAGALPRMIGIVRDTR